MSALRIHWCLPRGDGNTKAAENDLPDQLNMDGMVGFAQEAEELGIDSLLMGMGCHLPDPLPLLGALARETQRVTFILAYRPGLLPPTLFVQVANTVSWMADGRLALNIVAGISPAEQAYYGDFEAHDGRYRRTDEFLTVLHRFWRGESPISHEGQFYRIEKAALGLPYKRHERPRIYISGASGPAQQTAIALGDCWLRYGDTPSGIAAASSTVLAAKRAVGIRIHVLARHTRAEALAEIEAMMSNPDEKHRKTIQQFAANCDSEAVKTSFRLAEAATNDWLSPMLWTGAVAYRGGPALCVAGSYQEVAEYLLEYKRAGVSEFIFSGWPTRAEMRRFAQHVLPIVRELEGRERDR